ncbi:MAG TPA: gamma carbonic anhydrase family protein [Saprospiraceae bacterium]|nr:gamma carbonic anhydrase family protein [Saprospiraceae bacterium]MCB9272292.1 gamma carbonic anhydrase family protein [Lewinellaceae bacterium]HPG08099.1 gamma carbonic anhydrase family protein [Saprospiraceae bacterium]HPR00042.1 gamma carbonic anhydrase family protein [Saprospiraceae bacterium]HQU54182.1 gamma carbonic anhydrase family protein [Saprospiraceae bacterium]
MALIKSVRGFTPSWGEECFLAETATLIGDVMMGDQCSVWYNAVIRGDVNEIRIGNQVNIQDGAVIHCTYKKTGTYIGNRVSIGHLALVHGCTLEDNVLVGMGAIVMDNVVVPSNCLIAAGAVVLEKSILEAGYIYAGVPARKVKPLDPETAKFYITRTAANYVDYAEWFRNPS